MQQIFSLCLNALLFLSALSRGLNCTKTAGGPSCNKVLGEVKGSDLICM